MAWQDQTVLAVVPARAGSKRIPRKNLCEVGGLSLIARAARCAKSLDWIDRAVLSTDDEEMAEEGRRHGLEVPFLRPAEHATDSASSIAMWRHAWLASEQDFDQRFDLGILLQPTAPLRHPEEVERTVRALVEGGHRAATTVARVPAHFTPEKILRLGPDDRLSSYLTENGRPTRSQVIPAYFYLTGSCYAVTRETLVERGQIIEEDCVGIVNEGLVVNIDEPFELELAQLLADRGRLE